MDDRTCSIADCGGGGKITRGWCGKHYQAWRKYGDPLAKAAPKPEKACSIDGCDRKHSGRGWCHMHWQRWQKFGDPLYVADIYNDLPDETWLPVPGYEGCYEVSDLARVRSVPRLRTRGCMLKQQPSGPDGRLMVTMSKSGRTASKMVHRLVGEAFLGPLPIGLETRHLDGNCLNNAAYNLAYGTHEENMQDQLRHGTNANANKTHCPQNHPYSGGNLYVIPSSGGRMCRMCALEASRINQGYTGLGRWPKQEPAA